MTERCACLDVRDLPDGRRGAVMTLTYGRVRLVVGQPDSQFTDDAY